MKTKEIYESIVNGNRKQAKEQMYGFEIDFLIELIINRSQYQRPYFDVNREMILILEEIKTENIIKKNKLRL